MKTPSLIFSALKLIALTLLSTICTVGAQPQQVGFDRMLSPKLRQFLAGNPAAEQILAEAVTQTVSNRFVQIYYFYRDDESQPRTGAFAWDKSTAALLIRENQEPCDEYFSLLYSLFGVQLENRTGKLTEQVRAGAISRADFVREQRRIEFDLILKIRGLLERLKLTKRDQESSVYHKFIAECPEDFTEFLLYGTKATWMSYPSKYWDGFYETLRKGP